MQHNEGQTQTFGQRILLGLDTNNPEMILRLVLLGMLALFVIGFSIVIPDRFLNLTTLKSIGFQLPVLGLLTLAAYFPIVSGGLNLATVITANMCGLTVAAILVGGQTDPTLLTTLFAIIVALVVGTAIGGLIGAMIAYSGSHSILVSLGMMIFLEGIGEFFTRGRDISGMPAGLQFLGNETIGPFPIILIVLIICFAVAAVFVQRAPLGLYIRFVGSNQNATQFSGIDTKKVLTYTYAISGLLCALAGILMLARFNSVRVGHGNSMLLVSILACFLGGVNPFGGFGRVVNVFLALVCLQVLSSGMNLIGVNQHLATAMWGALIIVVMIIRSIFNRQENH